MNAAQYAILDTARQAHGGLYHGDSHDMDELVKARLMDYLGGVIGNGYYCITEAGRKAWFMEANGLGQP